jgi:predicted dehydrogenase
MNHGHINGQTSAMLRAGAELVSFYCKEPELAANYSKRFPQAKQARSEEEVLEDKSIHLVISASIPNERAPLGVRVMRSGKDFMVDKPGATSLAQLAEARRAQRETKRIYSIMYSERFENPATVKAGELVKAGAIGKVIQTIGLGPHRVNPRTRPAWFWDRKYFGGVICDIASHQFDHFDCSKEPLPYGEQLVNDILNRTETAMTQAHCFLATELALKAQQQARKLS